MFDSDFKAQVREYLLRLASRYTLRCVYDSRHESWEEFKEFLEDVASCSDKVSCTFEAVADMRLEFSIEKDGVSTGVIFRGIPGGHEFPSLLLALLNADGQGKTLPDEATAARIAALRGPLKLQTYVSLSCTNCPDVVQALNLVALYNPEVTHETVNGAAFSEEVEEKGIQAVPSVYADGVLIHAGRGSLGVLLQKLEEISGSQGATRREPITREYDVVVLGGGPAGSSAAIYSARKGLKVALVAESVGGQVKETVGIENLISVPYTTGEQLASSLLTHLEQYPVDLFRDRKIESVQLEGEKKTVYASGGETFVAPAVIIATGASWRRLDIDGESDYIGRGVAFCPHCDGPLYKGKDVAVIGGGNSGIEAAIDLAGICREVTVFEFLDGLKADEVLQRKLRELPNVKVFTSSQTVRVEGNGKKVTGIVVRDRLSGEERTHPLDGVFVQIGLRANSHLFEGQLELTAAKEIKTDGQGRSSIPGVYAAGDVSDVPYKQIIIAMGEGAKAALSAFADKMRKA